MREPVRQQHFHYVLFGTIVFTTYALYQRSAETTTDQSKRRTRPVGVRSGRL